MMSHLISTIAVLATGIAIGRKYHKEIDKLLEEVKANIGSEQPQEKDNAVTPETPSHNQ